MFVNNAILHESTQAYMILALSRLDPKKNVTTLLKAYEESKPLQELANLTLILGNRDDIEDMSTSSAGMLTTVLKLVDKYDLYGQVAFPKHHKQSDVPEIYRLAAKTKGVFINPAQVEPFGLTIIEVGFIFFVYSRFNQRTCDTAVSSRIVYNVYERSCVRTPGSTHNICKGVGCPP